MITVLIAILSSTVVSAVVTGIFNNKSKRKELRMNSNIQENHEWIKSISSTLNKYIQSNNEYAAVLADFAYGAVQIHELANYINLLNNNLFELTYYIKQVEYEEENANQIISTLTDIGDLFNTTREEAILYNQKCIVFNAENANDNNEELINEIYNFLDEFEDKINDLNRSLSIDLGNLVKKEKDSRINNILED